MKLWLDDIRKPPDDNWCWVKTAEEAIEVLASKTITEISLDHDLGEPERIVGNGYQVAKWLEAQMAEGNVSAIPSTISVHSTNPVGATNIRNAVEAIEKMRRDAGNHK